jgi:cell wall-associated NlpC family hydrolase
MDRRALAMKYAWEFVGVPYEWAGENPNGMDCSGFVSEFLQAVGVVPRGARYTAQQLYERFKQKPVSVPAAGCLVFHGVSVMEITHVEFLIDEAYTLAASGGGSKTTTLQAADQANAFVKLRPMMKSNLIAILDPF